MYFDHSKRSYYRFPSKNSVTDFDKQIPFYFPDKKSNIENLTDNSFDSNYSYKGDVHEQYSNMDIY